MPTCQEAYGEGFSGNYPNCQYSPTTTGFGGLTQDESGNWSQYDKESYTGGFEGTIGSLDFDEDFAGTSLSGRHTRGGPAVGDWEDYFDPYDPTKEKRAEETAGINIGQLQAGWDLSKGQLGETWAGQAAEFERQALGAGSLWDLQKSALERQSTEAGAMWDIDKAELERQKTGAQSLWGMQEAGLSRQERGAKEAFGLQREELGAQAGAGFSQARQAGASARKRSGLARSGTAIEMQRRGERDVQGQYRRGAKQGKAQLGQTLAGLGEQRGIGQERLSQSLAGLTGQIGRGETALTQAQAGYTSQIGIGQEGLSQTLAGLGYARGPEGALTATGAGQLGAGQLGYQQALETGAFDLSKGITDIGQGLKDKVWGYRDAWTDAMEAQKEDYLGMEIYQAGESRFP